MPARVSKDLRPGDIVVFRPGPETFVGRVSENRGPLGPGGSTVLRVEWTPTQSEEALEVELSADRVSLAIARSEWTRALARIDEFSARARVPGAKVGLSGRYFREARLALDTSIAAAVQRGEPKDFELVNRRCVENFGPAALVARRALSEGSSSLVLPTLARLPAMIEFETDLDRRWLTTDQKLESWQALYLATLDQVESDLPLDDDSTNKLLLFLIGEAADMAAWIRSTLGVGE